MGNCADWEIIICCHVFWYREGGYKDTVTWLDLITFRDSFIPRVGDSICLGEEIFEILGVELDYRQHQATVYVEKGLEEWYFTEKDMAKLIAQLRSCGRALDAMEDGEVTNDETSD